MMPLPKSDRRVFELMLIVTTIGITFLLWKMGQHRIVILNLFFLPIVLSGYFLGRTNAGVLALLSVLTVTIVTTLDPVGLAAFDDPIMIGLALTVWGGALGLTAILVGTLCDERSRSVTDLHQAYVGVVEVLSKYLQSGNPNVKARSIRVAELSQDIAEELRLSQREIDDVRVGALLHDLGHVEITTQLLNKAMGTLEASGSKDRSYTFSGTELVQSLGTVLKGAVPLLVSQDDAVRDCLKTDDMPVTAEIPIGAKIIRVVREYDGLMTGASGIKCDSPAEAVDHLRKSVAEGFDSDVLDALQKTMRRSTDTSRREPVLT